MGYQKTADICVKTGTYTDSNGDEKGRYENVGQVLTADDGGKLYLLKRTFNPAGVPNPDDKDSVLLSMFEPHGDRADAQPARKSAPKAAPADDDDDLDDSIPF